MGSNSKISLIISLFSGNWAATALPPLPARHEGEALEQVHVLFVLDQGAVQRRDQLLGVALAQRLGADVFDHEELEPVQQLRGRRLLLHAGYLGESEKQFEPS